MQQTGLCTAIVRTSSAWLGLCAHAAIVVASLFVVGCSGAVGTAGTRAGGFAGAGGGNQPVFAGAGNGSVISGGAAAPPVMITQPKTPFTLTQAMNSARKVKTLLTGMPVTDAEVAKVQMSGAAGLQELIHTWTTASDTQPMFRDKMLVFLRNAFQQTGFQATEDFKMQLLENGGFDFGPFGASAVGDDAFARLVQNLQDSFAITAWQLISDGRPFIETLTTQRYMMTTALKSLYLQIEAPNDQPYAFNFNRTGPAPLAWKIDYSGNPIPLEDSLNSASPNFMVFDDQAPTNAIMGRGAIPGFQNCRGGTAVDAKGAAVTSAAFTGQAQLFQRLIGFTPRFPFAAQPTCWEHAAKPYLTAQDTSDWQWVSVRPLKDTETQLRSYDLPTLRTTTELGLRLPRIGFYTTPAFLALWNTNDSNQHRVTANQTLLVALGMSFTSADGIVPLSTAGLDAEHAVSGSECYGCHKNLDPMRAFWGNQYDFNDRNDFPTRGFMMTASNPRPKTLGGVFAFLDVNANGGSLLDFGALLAKVSNGASPEPLNVFARAMTQKLCYYANSVACEALDPEFQRVVLAFQKSNFDFHVLISELFASPLVTGVSATMTFAADAMPVSVARRDHLCAALSNRLGKPDVCALAAALPTPAQAATVRIASSVAADAFSRGSEAPITPTEPTLFHRAATEMLCENLSTQVVDATAGTVYTSANFTAALADMVDKIIGYPTTHTAHAPALQILTDHYNAVRAQKGNTATQALRSTFVLACEAPSAVAIGL